MTVITIDPVTVPASVESSDAGDFLAMIGILNTAVEHDLGRDHLQWHPAEELPGWHDESDMRCRGFLARVGGEPVAALQLMLPTEEAAVEVEFDLLTLPEWRGRGLEEALLERLLAEAGAAGRSVVQTYTLHPIPGNGDRMPAPTGFGGAPVDVHTRFFRDHGFTLEQVERNSIFDLQASPAAVEALLAESLAAAGPERPSSCASTAAIGSARS